ncbi:MAG: tetratricopeptide repeat protein [Bacillota bacterium]
MLRAMRKRKRFTKVIFTILALALSLSLVVLYVNNPTSNVNGGTGTGNTNMNNMTGTTNTGDTSSPAADEISSMQTKIRQQDEALKANPKNLTLLIIQGNDHYDLGLKYYERGSAQDGTFHLSKAADVYKQALAIDGKNVDVRVDMATAYFYTDQNELAEEGFLKAIEDDPNHINAHVNYGIFLRDAKQDNQGAIKQWEAALSLKPDRGTADRLKGLIDEAR